MRSGTSSVSGRRAHPVPKRRWTRLPCWRRSRARGRCSPSASTTRSTPPRAASRHPSSRRPSRSSRRASPGRTPSWSCRAASRRLGSRARRRVARVARNVAEADAWGHVAGLTVGQDLSEREVQYRPPVPQFSLGKSFPGFGPIGPWLVTPDELADPRRPRHRVLTQRRGGAGEPHQRPDLRRGGPGRRLSAIVTLLPGDIVFTGTPAGVGVARDPQRFLAGGDVLVSTIEGVGTLRTRCGAGTPH